MHNERISRRCVDNDTRSEPQSVFILIGQYQGNHTDSGALCDYIAVFSTKEAAEAKCEELIEHDKMSHAQWSYSIQEESVR